MMPPSLCRSRALRSAVDVAEAVTAAKQAESRVFHDPLKSALPATRAGFRSSHPVIDVADLVAHALQKLTMSYKGDLRGQV
jgi:hypothetical protein